MGRSRIMIAISICMVWAGLSATSYAVAQSIVDERHIEKVRNRQYPGGDDESNLVVRENLPNINRLSDSQIEQRSLASEEEAEENSKNTDTAE